MLGIETHFWFFFSFPFGTLFLNLLTHSFSQCVERCYEPGTMGGFRIPPRPRQACWCPHQAYIYSVGKDRLYYFFKFIYFNWRLITLQYCSGFAIHWHESAMGIHVSPSWTPLLPPSPSHLSGSSQCTSPERPVSCIEPGLAICFTYGNIHVSMLFSQIIPHSPSPTESKRLFYTSVSLLLERQTLNR